MKTLSIVAGFLMTWWSAGQANAQVQSGDEDRPECYHQEFDAMQFLAGDWKVAGSVRLPDGEWQEVKGWSRITADLEGCVLIEHYRDDRTRDGFSGIAVFSYDPIDRRLQKTWIDSGHGLAMLFRGGPVGEKTIFSASKEIGASTQYFVEEYSVPEPDRLVLERRRSADNRQSWRATSRVEYERD